MVRKRRRAPPQAGANGVGLLSGGLDSTVSLTLARRKGINILLALTFDYGQLAVQPEIKAARAVCRSLKIKHQVIKLSWLSKFSRGKKIPRLRLSDLERKKRLVNTARAVWVPNRNGLFINIAAAFAEALDGNTPGGGSPPRGCRYVITGFNREEAVTFPDNSGQFIRSINRSLAWSTLTGVEVISYTARLDKAEIIRRGRMSGAPIDLTWSCYQGGRSPCGRCESCLRRRRVEKQVCSSG